MPIQPDLDLRRSGGALHIVEGTPTKVRLALSRVSAQALADELCALIAASHAEATIGLTITETPEATDIMFSHSRGGLKQ